MTTRFKKAAGSTILAIGLCTTGAAGADVLATSVINLTGLVFTNDAGDPFTQGLELNVLAATNSSPSNTANLNGTVESITNATSDPGDPIDLPVLLGGGTAVPSPNDLCIGDGCPEANNEFEASLRSSALGDPSGNQAYSDQLLQGAAIVLPGVPVGAQVATEATAQLTDDGGSSAASENGLNATIDFIFAGTDATHFNVAFNAAAYLEAFRSADVAFPDGTVNALGSYEVSFRLTDLTTNTDIFQWNPDGVLGNAALATEFADPFNLNTTVGVDEFSLADVDFVGAGLGTANTGVFSAQSSELLVTGNRYRLTAAEKTSVNITQTTNNVPAPATLSIFGLGLIGMGLMRWRSKAGRSSVA